MSNPEQDPNVSYLLTPDEGDASHTAQGNHDDASNTSDDKRAAASGGVKFQSTTTAFPPPGGHGYPLPPSLSSSGENISQRRPSLHSDSRSIGSSASRTTNASIITIVSRDAVRQQRTNHLAARYGLTLSSDFPPERNQALSPNRTEPLQRVQKSARLRMHATCHLCNTSFLASSTCPQCNHRRCKACPRAAPKGVQALSDQTKQRFDTLPRPSEQVPAYSLLSGNISGMNSTMRCMWAHC